MSGESELNKSEEATPFKLEQARRKGSVARGTDLGFFSALGAFLLFLSVAGAVTANSLIAFMRSTIGDFSSAVDPSALLPAFADGWSVLLTIVGTLGLMLLVIVVPVELFQLRGLTFSAHPLKPDFRRLNPAAGFKRLFSLKTLKEAVKNVVKFLIYGLVTAVALNAAWQSFRADMNGSRELAIILWSKGLSLLAMFVAAALLIAAIDQIIARREFSKQMRMSRSELTREHKEREGEPRIKARRKQLHAEFAKQTEGLGNLPGSDLLIVNPQHFAVALSYDAASMQAPAVRARARNRLALAMKRDAARLNIPIISDPPLARALFRNGKPGQQIASEHYRDVAKHYSRLRAAQ